MGFLYRIYKIFADPFCGCVCLLQVCVMFELSGEVRLVFNQFFFSWWRICFWSWMRNNLFRFNMIKKEVFFFWCLSHSPQKLGNWVDFLLFVFSVWLIFCLHSFFFLCIFFSSAFFFPLLFFFSAFFFSSAFFVQLSMEYAHSMSFFFLFKKIPFSKNEKCVFF